MEASSAADDRAAIAAKVAGFQRVPISRPGLRPGLRPASVAICVLLQGDAPCLLRVGTSSGVIRRSTIPETVANGRRAWCAGLEAT